MLLRGNASFIGYKMWKSKRQNVYNKVKMCKIILGIMVAALLNGFCVFSWPVTYNPTRNLFGITRLVPKRLF